MAKQILYVIFIFGIHSVDTYKVPVRPTMSITTNPQATHTHLKYHKLQAMTDCSGEHTYVAMQY